MSDQRSTAIAGGSAAIDPPEMVLVAREWAAERARKFRDERNNLIEAWAWRTYADLCEIAEFAPAAGEIGRLRDLLNSAADALAAYYDDESYAEEGLIQLIEEAVRG